MTKDEILKLEAGRELDALVAEKVMGLEVVLDGWNTPHKPGNSWLSDPLGYFTGKRTVTGGPHKHYSTDVAAAWEVLEKVVGGLGCNILYLPGGTTAVKLSYAPLGGRYKEFIAEAKTVSLAICRAALLAVMEPK